MGVCSVSAFDDGHFLRMKAAEVCLSKSMNLVCSHQAGTKYGGDCDQEDSRRDICICAFVAWL